MHRELVSKKTRNEFREVLTGWVLRRIESVFDEHQISYNPKHDPGTSGERRSFVEQHYYTLDFSRPFDVYRLLMVYEEILNTELDELDGESSFDPDAKRRELDRLVKCLRNDGYKFEYRKISSSKPETRAVFRTPATDITISEVTRRSILGYLQWGQIDWWGRLSEVEFLSRLYDLESLPSTDKRMESAKGDIVQHRLNNPTDWSDDWVFWDDRFELLDGSDEVLLQFLREIVHPVVRPDAAEALGLVTMLNELLSPDNWELYEETKMSGRPVFGARRIAAGMSPILGAVESVAVMLDAHYVQRQLTRMQSSIESDPELAIGTAKEFVETICKTILHEYGEDLPKGADLVDLVKRVRTKLDLLPEDIPDRAKGVEAIKRLLSNLGTVAQGLGELRNLYGSGHGKHSKSNAVEPRHARLAVGAAGTLGVFLYETFQKRKAE